MKSIPSSPGIYVVTLSNEKPISVNADRPHAERCIFVNKDNCKFGRAQNLARRYRDYIKTFGVEHVTFEVVVFTDSPEQLEAAVSARLSDFRIRGLTGRPNEWLAGTTPASVKKIILEVANEQSAAASAGVASVPVPLGPSHPLVQLGQPPRTASADLSEIVEAACYLRDAGMSSQLLKDLHHFSSRKETYASTIRYFSITRDIRPVNVAYGARMQYVEHAHRSGRGHFESLVAEALAYFPMNINN